MVNTQRECPDIETSTDDYARRFNGPVGTWLLDVQWDAIHQLLATCPGQSVLELGGGHAQLTGSLLDHGYHVTVMGSDESCAKRVRPFIEPNRCQFHTGDLLNLPYADQSFDTVIAIRLMAHVEDWPRFLAEATRVARHAVIIDYPSLVSVNRVEKLLFGLKKALEGNTRHYRCFTTKMIADACKPHGYFPVSRRRQFFCPMVVHRALKMPRLSHTLEACCRALGLTVLLGSPVILKLARTEEATGSSAATAVLAAMRLLIFTHWG